MVRSAVFLSKGLKEIIIMTIIISGVDGFFLTGPYKKLKKW